MGLRKDDPVYYKVMLQRLLKQAKNNNLELSLGNRNDKSTLYFTADTGESAGVVLVEKQWEMHLKN